MKTQRERLADVLSVADTMSIRTYTVGDPAYWLYQADLLLRFGVRVIGDAELGEVRAEMATREDDEEWLEAEALWRVELALPSRPERPRHFTSGEGPTPDDALTDLLAGIREPGV